VGATVEVVVDPLTKDRLAIELPLRYDSPPEQARAALGLGDYVDVSDPVVARAVELLKALLADGVEMPVGLLGGTAYRFRCPSSNSTTLGLRRPLHDIDMACHHADVKKFRAALLGLGARHGSGLTVVETHADHMFNALQGGRRLRFRTVDSVVDGRVVLGTLDVLADEFRFCHNLDLTKDVTSAPKDGHSLPLATLLLTKLQFIQSIPAQHRALVPGRVLAPFGKKEFIIGPEDKDVRDILAVLLDHSVGEEPNQISLRRFLEPLGNDWGFWTTVKLNLDHLLKSPLFSGLSPERQATIRGHAETLLGAMEKIQPKRHFAFLQKEWWEPVESLAGLPSP
jgi:hypothetical protein